MKILLAGPGTGKTTNIQSIIKGKPDLSKILIISFTNATVEDLKKSLVPIGVNESSCMTLHKFAVKYNHDKTRHVLEAAEEDVIKQISKQTEIPFDNLCNFLLATTFDQMIERFVGYAKSNGAYFEEKLSDYSMIIVDEYQDFNEHEQQLIDLLVGVMEEAYIMGDDDQCIYDFKDASNEKIMALYVDAAHEKIAHEHKCYRCPDVVVDTAAKLIKNNKKRIDKKWEKTGKKGSLFVKQFLSNSQTIAYVIDEVAKILEASKDEKALILSPVRFFAEPLVHQLQKTEIKHRNYFARKIPEDVIVKSWSLKFLFGTHKYLNLILIGYQVISPRRKLYELVKKHYDGGQDLEELYQLLENKIPNETKTTYENIDEALNEEFFQSVASYYKDAEGEKPAEKLEKLFLIADTEIEERVNVMSIHKSKGLGADHVFMIGLVEGIIPNRARGNDTIESQRRLFYVGMTRAKKTLHLISSVNLEGKYVNTVNKGDFKYEFRSKFWKGRASRFIEELNK